MSFDTSTRLKYITMPTLTKPTGGGTVSVDLPRSGILSRIWVHVAATIGGVPVAPLAPLGTPQIIRRIRLSLNNGIDVFNVSGAGFQYLVREFMDNYADSVPQADRVTVAAATSNQDFIIPVFMNTKDPFGAIMLQNEQTLATLIIEFESDTTVAAGAAITATATPVLGVFEVPNDPQDWPPLSTIHAIIEDQQAIAGAGDFTYNWPRGNTYLGVYHLLNGTTYTQARLRTQQSIFLADHSPDTQRMLFNNYCNDGRDMNLTGTAITGFNNRVFWDLMGSDGLGSFGTVRDVINSAALTDLASVITCAGAGTLISVRRQLIYLTPAITAS